VFFIAVNKNVQKADLALRVCKMMNEFCVN
jgi:hypothetical protein